MIRTCLNTHVTTNLANLMVLYLITADDRMISLLSRSALTLTKLTLQAIHFGTVFTSPLPRLKELSLNDCDGYINSLLAAVAFNVECLELQSIDLETKVYLPMPKLKVVKIADEDIDIRESSLLTEAGKLAQLITNNSSNLKRRQSEAATKHTFKDLRRFKGPRGSRN